MKKINAQMFLIQVYDVNYYPLNLKINYITINLGLQINERDFAKCYANSTFDRIYY